MATLYTKTHHIQTYIADLLVSPYLTRFFFFFGSCISPKSRKHYYYYYLYAMSTFGIQYIYYISVVW